MTHPTTVRFDQDEYRRLREMARRRDTTVSELIRRAVRNSYFRKDRDESVAELLDYIDNNRDPVDKDIDEIEDEIGRALGDAAL